MKAHVGVDTQTKLIHSVAATAANVHDSQVLPQLLHGQETRVWGDSAYSGQRDVIRHHAPKAKSFIQAKAHRPLSEAERARNHTKSTVQANVEHAFLVIKRSFGWAKVRYCGLAKNIKWLFVTCSLTNLYSRLDGVCWRERRARAWAWWLWTIGRRDTRTKTSLNHRITTGFSVSTNS